VPEVYLTALAVLTGAELNSLREREATGGSDQSLKSSLRRYERGDRRDAP
jgi:hypothetical protein